MKPNRVKGLIMGALMALMLTASFGGLTTTANAQGRVVHRPPRVVYYRPIRPFWPRYYDPFWSPYWWGPTYTYVDPITAQREEGYREGRDEGKKAAKKGLLADPKGNKDYLKSNSMAYREAFVQGYNERYQEKLAEIRKEQSEKGN